MLDSFGNFSFIIRFFSEGNPFFVSVFSEASSSGILSQEKCVFPSPAGTAKVCLFWHSSPWWCWGLTSHKMSSTQLMCTELTRGTKAVGFLQNVGLLWGIIAFDSVTPHWSYKFSENCTAAWPSFFLSSLPAFPLSWLWTSEQDSSLSLLQVLCVSFTDFALSFACIKCQFPNTTTSTKIKLNLWLAGELAGGELPPQESFVVSQRRKGRVCFIEILKFGLRHVLWWGMIYDGDLGLVETAREGLGGPESQECW